MKAYLLQKRADRIRAGNGGKSFLQQFIIMIKEIICMQLTFKKIHTRRIDFEKFFNKNVLFSKISPARCHPHHFLYDH